MPCNARTPGPDDIRPHHACPFPSKWCEATAEAAIRARPGLTVAGVLAADACLEAELYHRAFASRGVEVRVPDGEGRAVCMALIGRIKAGDAGPEVRAAMAELARGLVEVGAEVVVAGCTEVPLVLDGAGPGVPLINSTDVLAERAAAFALGSAPAG
jgi:aspartate racemase